MSLLRFSWVSLIVGCASGVDDVGGTFGTWNPTSQTSATASRGDSETGDATSDGTTSGGGFDGTSQTGVDDEDTADGSQTSTTGNTSDGDDGDDDGEDDPVDPTEGPMELNVQNYTGACGGIVWCTNQETMQGIGPHASAECFDNVGAAPPYDVIEVRYNIGAKQADPTSLKVEVRSWASNAPGGVLGSQTLTASNFAVGVNSIVLQNPIRVTENAFCVVLDANEPFGIRRDEGNPVPNRAFIKADQCSINTYTPLQNLNMGEFAANFCMSAKIRTVR